MTSRSFDPAKLATLLDSGVVFESILVRKNDVEALRPLEGAEIPAREWAEKRLREYRAGRHCAKIALERIGSARSCLPRDDDGLPLFPSGVAASITHTGREETLAIAIAGTGFTGLGIDAEERNVLSREVAAQVGTPEEIALLGAKSGDELAPLLLFSAKEAFYKCAYPKMRHFLGFRDVTLTSLRAEGERFVFRFESSLAASRGGPGSLDVLGVLAADYVVTTAGWR